MVCGFFAYKKIVGRTETRTRDSQDVPREDTISLRHLPRGSSKNCDLQFANVDRLMANYSIDMYSVGAYTLYIE